MSWEQAFIDRLAEVEISNVFNPYRHRCDVHDLDNAAPIRRNNLEIVLKARHAMSVDSIWFGRDLGYRGGRRTGLALTDEVTMHTMVGPLGMPLRIAKATHGTPIAERTAAVIWNLIKRLPRAPMLWNAFPFHPHEREAHFTNRAHTARERRETAWSIEALVERFNGPKLIAIGNDASKALSDLGFTHENARHPSYGGQREFIETMERLHDLKPVDLKTAEPVLL